MTMYEALKALEKNKHKLSPQQYRTLKGQILAGDIEGAIKGFKRIMRKGK